jgi:hypothetical protein
LHDVAVFASATGDETVSDAPTSAAMAIPANALAFG